MKSLKKRREIAAEVLLRLKREFGVFTPTLNFSSAWELLVGGILAAQCTDERVNIITDKLFVKYPEIRDYAEAPLEDIEDMVRTAGLFRNKAKAIKGSAEMIMTEFDGEVPAVMDDLLSLPGVGRKIANLVLGDWFEIPGMVVDTHCKRISTLLGMTDANSPAAIERQLVKAVPQELWIDWGHYLVTLGRNQCRARCRQCAVCPLTDICAFAAGHKQAIAEAAEREPERCIG